MKTSMTAVRAYLSDLREGVRILTGPAFWRDFRTYWSADAIAERMAAWAERNRKP